LARRGRLKDLFFTLLLLISGKPIGEPVAWNGLIVMNTQEELEIAFEEYQNGTFIKHWYVTVVGGMSADLKSNQVGVNMEALAENTDIVPLDEKSPDASLKSPIGEVGLSITWTGSSREGQRCHI
jgi:hypothetical protein